MATPPPAPSRSTAGPLPGLVGTLAALAWIVLVGRAGPVPKAPPPPPIPAPIPVEAPAPAPAPAPVAAPPAPRPAPPPPPPRPGLEPDRGAIARAEADLDAATRARAVAEARLADAEIALRKASLASAADVAEGRGLAFRVRDPSARIERANNQVARAEWESKRIGQEIAALADVPRPKARPLRDRAAVARPVDGKEYHFEVRGDRVAVLDIEKLTELVKAEARLHLRMNVRGRPFGGTVGPVGEFSMRYEMAPEMPLAVAEALGSREISYGLRGWEIVPEGENRGETYERSREPISIYARAVGRLSPSRATITFWIYPDGFALYRRLRDDLHARGFLVAARPLPEGMTIRGSPAGSLSAGQ